MSGSSSASAIAGPLVPPDTRPRGDQGGCAPVLEQTGWPHGTASGASASRPRFRQKVGKRAWRWMECCARPASGPHFLLLSGRAEQGCPPGDLEPARGCGIPRCWRTDRPIESRRCAPRGGWRRPAGLVRRPGTRFQGVTRCAGAAGVAVVLPCPARRCAGKPSGPHGLSHALSGLGVPPASP